MAAVRRAEAAFSRCAGSRLRQGGPEEVRRVRRGDCTDRGGRRPRWREAARGGVRRRCGLKEVFARLFSSRDGAGAAKADTDRDWFFSRYIASTISGFGARLSGSISTKPHEGEREVDAEFGKEAIFFRDREG